MLTTIKNLFTRWVNKFNNLEPLYDRTVPADVRWQISSDRYVVDEFDTFNQQAAFLAAHPEAELVIEGHCDSLEVSSREAALKLGEQRARAHRDVLHYQCGVALDRTVMVSYGYERPLFHEPADDQQHRLNRRTHTLVR
jgi:outer membrane protein OmpA-like peptidoglycan-associated protein